MKLINSEVTDINSIINLLTQRINELLAKQSQIIIAIDGNCTAGKTTLASHLGSIYDCNIFHMDDFFLPPKLRTAERLATPGGNVHYERFHDEVLIPLTSCKAYSYRPYDCHIQALTDAVQVLPKPLNIVEGTYSMHPELASAYDLSIFLHITPDVQRERILTRAPQLHENFFNKWIPMEELYFKECRVKERCEIILDTIFL